MASTTNYSFIILLFLLFSLKTQARVMTERNFFKAARNSNVDDQLSNPFEEDHVPFPTQQTQLKPIDDQLPDPFEDHVPFPTQQNQNGNGLYGNAYYQEVQEARKYTIKVDFNQGGSYRNIYYQEVQEARKYPIEVDFNQGGSYANRDSTDTKDTLYRSGAASETTFFWHQQILPLYEWAADWKPVRGIKHEDRTSEQIRIWRIQSWKQQEEVWRQFREPVRLHLQGAEPQRARDVEELNTKNKFFGVFRITFSHLKEQQMM